MEDNGSGFSIDEVMDGAATEGIGLSTLRERVELMGGELKLSSTLGEGSRTSFMIPVQDELGAF